MKAKILVLNSKQKYVPQIIFTIMPHEMPHEMPLKEIPREMPQN